MRNQPAFLNADTAIRLHSNVTATLQLQRLCAVFTFARPVSTVLETSPPPCYTAVNPCRSRQERDRGREDWYPHRGILHPGSDSHTHEHARNFPARHTVRTRTDSSLDSPRDCAVAPTPESPQGAFRVAPNLFIQGIPEPTNVVPGKTLSPFRLFRGRLAVGSRPRLTWFLRERAAFSTGVRRLSRCPKNDAAQPRVF